jgi:hypothetical protein
MKHLATTTLVVLFTLTAVSSFAQQATESRTLPIKPALFSKFPDVINCTATQLNNFFNRHPGENINVSFNNTLTLSGNIKSCISKYSNLQTVVVKLPLFNNILFTLSKRADQQNNIVYVGHLFDPAYADGYELKKISPENYQFIKIIMDKVLPTCNQ